jgi:hypothetical protein
VFVLLAAIASIAADAARAQGTVCDSPCKFIHLPLVVPKSEVVMLTDPQVSMLQQIYKPYMFYQVDTVAKPTTSARPSYPDDMEQRINGMVIGLIIVDSLGNAVPGSMQLLYSTDRHFTAVAREWMRTMRFSPARLGARHVAQIVQQDFVFVPQP